MPHVCNLPTRFSFVPSSGRWRFEEDRLTLEKVLVLEFPDELDVLMSEKRGESFRPDRSALDPWKLRDRFLRLERSESTLLDFVNDTGRWDGSLGPYRVRDIWSWQDVINDLLLHPSRDWQDTITQHLNSYAGAMDLGGYLDLVVEFSGSTFWFELTPRSCVGALLATVLIDRSEGARFKVCRRFDCHKTYRLESQHKRKYCSYDCAHLQSVRNSRKQKSKK